MKRKLEICCYSVESALIAEKAGADRIELCDNYPEGGTTPSAGMIKYCSTHLKIPVNVIIRPRGGDFLYSDSEFAVFKDDVKVALDNGANGIVLGFLKANADIDLARTEEIIKLTGNNEITFHRAFDMCRDTFKALSQLIELGISRILTSGTKNKAIEGIDILSELVKQAGNNIIIMPGSGVNENNIAELLNHTGAIEFHSSAKTFTKSKMQHFNKSLSMGGNSAIDEYAAVSVDAEKIRKMKNIIAKNVDNQF